MHTRLGIHIEPSAQQNPFHNKRHHIHSLIIRIIMEIVRIHSCYIYWIWTLGLIGGGGSILTVPVLSVSYLVLVTCAINFIFT
jgi:hypothetical protein